MSAEDVERYHRAMHAVQSGVAAEQGMGSPDGEPKHLRVGIVSAVASHAGLARLLIDKGLITLDEYERAAADQMEVEQHTYEERLTAATGIKVTLS